MHALLKAHASLTWHDSLARLNWLAVFCPNGLFSTPIIGMRAHGFLCLTSQLHSRTPLCSYVNWPEEQWAGGACESQLLLLASAAA